MAEAAYNRQGVEIHCGDALAVLKTLPSESVHCCCTSPPYWSLRDYGCDGQLGLEATPAEYAAKMVAVFEEVRRVLRKDGTAWVNMGDGYAANRPGAAYGWTNGKTSERDRKTIAAYAAPKERFSGLKPKDLIGMPWMLAFALRDAGWYLRQDIIWAKPSPMPESVRDRCTKAHEYIFLLAKSPRYYYDGEAIAEEATQPIGVPQRVSQHKQDAMNANLTGTLGTNCGKCNRNKRSVWTVVSEPYPAAHFATFPTKLIEPCILAGCPEQCCAACGAPYVAQIERERVATRPGTNSKVHGAMRPDSPYMDHKSIGNRDPERHCTTRRIVGCKPTCTCDAGAVPGTVLDPFLGSGTTAQVARELGRNCIGIELNPEYIDLCEKRLEQGVLF